MISNQSFFRFILLAGLLLANCSPFPTSSQIALPAQRPQAEPGALVGEVELAELPSPPLVAPPLGPETAASLTASEAVVNTSPDNATVAQQLTTARNVPPVVIAPTAAPPLPPTPEILTAPVAVAIASDVPEDFAASLRNIISQTPLLANTGDPQTLSLIDAYSEANVRISLGATNAPGFALWERYFAAVVPFDTVRDDISLDEMRQRWRSGAGLFTTPELPFLPVVLGAGSAPQADNAELLNALLNDRTAVGLLPFEQLNARFKVLNVDGVNVLNNRFESGAYGLGVALKVDGTGAASLTSLLRGAIQPTTNREAGQLTSLMMTGVTAMARATAAKMEQKGYTYPAEIIGPTLAQADITHISNEIPFLDDCVVQNFENNLTLCSHTAYWAALEASGTDIIGLSGNHVNDFGYEGARRSLQWYKDHNIAIYGSGFTVEEACAPLLWQHNGNRFAFLAALAFGPSGAWVTESEPGACYYYDHKDLVLETIRQLAQQVDIVAVELQYEESYNPWPLSGQVADFRELRAAGADIVTGVQSHVPQALEPYGAQDTGGPGIIVYGLGNLYFDQMWSWDTRTELYVRHAIYQGRLLNSEILTGVLEDFAQPRWADANERAEILTRIFTAAPQRP